MKNHASHRLLLVEDDDDHAILTKDAIMRGCHYQERQIVRLSTVREALEALKNGSFRAVVLDLNLPDSSGIETIDKVKTIDSSVAIVVLTSIGDEALANESLKHGAQDFISKADLKPSLVEKTLRHSIERKKIENVLGSKIEELETFNRLAIGREKRIIELKGQVNDLLAEMGKSAEYDLSFVQEGKT